MTEQRWAIYTRAKDGRNSWEIVPGGSEAIFDSEDDAWYAVDSLVELGGDWSEDVCEYDVRPY